MATDVPRMHLVSGPERIPLPGPTLRGMSVLLVDDNEDILDLLGVLLGAHGAAVRCAASADEACQHIDEAAPDILVSDLSMPGRDGYSLLRHVRDAHPTVPCVAFSALAGGEEQKRALEAGFDAFVLKPVEPVKLVSVIASVAQARASGAYARRGEEDRRAG